MFFVEAISKSGAGWPTNALAGDPDPNARRIIGYGLRNPFRFTIRPTESWKTAPVKLSRPEDFRVDENFYVNAKDVLKPDPGSANARRGR